MNTLLLNLPVWQKNHIDVCVEKNLFEGKKVLEIGGCIPYEVVKSLNVKSWFCIDPAYSRDIIYYDDYKLIKASVLDYGEDYINIGGEFSMMAGNSADDMVDLDHMGFFSMTIHLPDGIPVSGGASNESYEIKDEVSWD